MPIPESVLDAIQKSAIAEAVSKSDHLVGAGLQVLHIFGFVLLLASLVLLSLRLLGAALQGVPVEGVARDARRLGAVGLVLAVFSGVLIFIATPRLYVGNWAFQLKLLLFLVASLFQLLVFRRVARRSDASLGYRRLAVGASLTLWFGIGLAGRLIGFI